MFIDVFLKRVVGEFTKAGIPIWLLSDDINSCENIKQLKKYQFDIIVIIAGNQIIKKELLDIPKYGVINAHCSLLPDYKGLMPSFWVLYNKEKQTGVSVYFLNEEIDAGPIIKQKVVKIEPSMPQSKLIRKTKQIANDLLIESLNEIEDDCVKTMENFGCSYYKFPTKENVKEFYKNGSVFF